MLVKAGLNNVVLSTMLNAVNNIVENSISTYKILSNVDLRMSEDEHSEQFYDQEQRRNRLNKRRLTLCYINKEKYCRIIKNLLTSNVNTIKNI